MRIHTYTYNPPTARARIDGVEPRARCVVARTLLLSPLREEARNRDQGEGGRYLEGFRLSITSGVAFPGQRALVTRSESDSIPSPPPPKHTLDQRHAANLIEHANIRYITIVCRRVERVAGFSIQFQVLRRR